MSENNYDEDVNKDAEFDSSLEDNDTFYTEEAEETLQNFGEYEESLRSELEESQSFLEEEKKKEPQPILPLSEENVLRFRNFNLQVVLADKSIENLDLRKNILTKEKKEVLDEIESLKETVGLEHDVDISEYYFDLPNNRIIHKSLLQK